MFGRLLVVLVLVAAVGGGYFYVKTHTTHVLSTITHLTSQKDVKGASIHGTPTPSLLQSNIAKLQEQITQLSPKDISSASPQVQAIIKTIQSIPVGEAHDVCVKLCGNYLK